MEVLSGPVVVLSGPELAVLGRQLGEAIRSAYTVRGRPAPRVLLDFAIAVSTAARSAEVPAPEPPRFRPPPPLPSSDQPVMLITEAARAAEVSTSYMRRLVRRGDVEASRDGRGAYLVRADSVAAWISGRRKETDDAEAA